MTGMSDDERIRIVIEAARSLRVPVDPPYDLWPEIRRAAGIRTHRLRLWVMIAAVLVALVAVIVLVATQQFDGDDADKRSASANARVQLEAAASMTSDHYKAQRLIRLSAAARTDTLLARRIIDAARPIQSSRDKMSVLIALADAGAVSTDALRDSYLAVAHSIVSSANRDRAITSLTQKR
jgi:hypothetical protein